MLTREDQLDLDMLRKKLAARLNKPGFKANCACIQARIAELEAVEHGDGVTLRGESVDGFGNA